MKQRLVVPAIGLGVFVLLVFAIGTGRASTLPLDLTPTASVYLPFIGRPYTCPLTSSHQYSGGIAYQYDQDNPVRPAYNHADKNLELRGYTINTDTDLQRELVDYGSDDPTQPPQFATLFDPYRVPALINFYRVHDWIWAPSPDPGSRGDPITSYPVTALGLQTTPGETLHVPTSGYNIGDGMEALVLFADEDTIALRYTREDSSGSQGYTVHIDNICTDPNLLALYNSLDDPNGPRYEFPNPSYDLPNLYAGQPLGTARSTEIIVAITDTGAFMDTRSCNEWWQIRPDYPGTCPPAQADAISPTSSSTPALTAPQNAGRYRANAPAEGSDNALPPCCGLPPEVEEWEQQQAALLGDLTAASYAYPPAADWRNMDGTDYTTPVKSQSSCGSCVAFATVAAIESRMEVVAGDPDLNPDLAEGHLFACGGGTCDYGWYPSVAMNFAQNTGIVDEPCFPYRADDQSCTGERCADWESRVTKIDAWRGVSDAAEMKYLLTTSGPFVATFTVYPDFYYEYTGGVYRWDGQGEPLGGHAVAIVGYNEPEQYWIVKNSWGSGWGENGYFRIGYGEVGIDNYVYVPEISASPTLSQHTYLPLVARNFGPAIYPDDPYYDQQWGLAQVDAPRAWGISHGSADVLIAVLDSGTDLDHPDLADKVRTDIDRDFVNNDDEADDDHGHGTHVSGIAAAATNNAQGVAGLGWEATLLPLKVLDADGNGYADDLANAIRYAADQGAEVINMSLGGAVPCPYYVQSAVDYAYTRGILLVAAAGNNEGHSENFPANCTHVLGVAATDPDDTRASYSNYGNHVSVAAPGSSIYSTLMGGGYGYMSGTSMATPYVAGLAALVYSRYPTYTPDQIASAILDNALDIGTPGWDMYTGCGRIVAYQSLLQGAQGSSPLCLEGVGPYLKSQTPNPKPQIVPGEIIVTLRPGVSVEAVSLQYKTSAEFLPTLDAWLFHVPPGQERTILAWLRADPAVAHADLNYVVTAAP